MGQLWETESSLSTEKQSHLHRTAWRHKNRILPDWADKGKGKLKILLILCMCRELQRDLISWTRGMLGSGLTCSGSCSRQRPGEWCTAACHSSTRSGERTHTAKQGRKAASPWGFAQQGSIKQTYACGHHRTLPWPPSYCEFTSTALPSWWQSLTLKAAGPFTSALWTWETRELFQYYL